MLLTLLLLAAAPSADIKLSPQVLAFPGAEGFGRFTRGGRGGQVIRVTTLADSGHGSLRAAIETTGPRTVIFDIGGTITLASPLKIGEPNLTLAGQTAPGDGITLRGQPLIVAADQVIVRYLRVRLGDETGVQDDAVDVRRGRGIILDHISASWSVDETLSVGSRYSPPQTGVYDVTVQWSVIAQSLNRSAHDKGRHGYGSLLRGGHGSRFSFRYNLWAHHQARMPRPGNYSDRQADPIGAFFEFRNNLFYDWGGDRSGYNADKDALAAYDFVGNWYQAGPASTGALAFCEENAASRAFFRDNAMNGAVPADPWSLIGCTPPAGYRASAPLADAGGPVLSPRQAYEAVLARAGASRVRDTVDLRIIASVRDRSGGLIDSQADVGGWPDLKPGTPWRDSDGDGMPDDWERAEGLDPSAPDGDNDRNNDMTTNLEDWLNSLT